MHILLVLFACEAGEGGRCFGPEMEVRVKAAIRYLHAHPEAEVMAALQAAGFYEPNGYSELVMQRFIDAGISPIRMHFRGRTTTTLEEIQHADTLLCERPGLTKVVALATWNQLPRIWALWWWHRSRNVGLIWVPYFGLWTWWRTLLEPAKFVLGILPAGPQQFLGMVCRKIGILK